MVRGPVGTVNSKRRAGAFLKLLEARLGALVPKPNERKSRKNQRAKRNGGGFRGFRFFDGCSRELH